MRLSMAGPDTSAWDTGLSFAACREFAFGDRWVGYYGNTAYTVSRKKHISLSYHYCRWNFIPYVEWLPSNVTPRKMLGKKLEARWFPHLIPLVDRQDIGNFDDPVRARDGG